MVIGSRKVTLLFQGKKGWRKWLEPMSKQGRTFSIEALVLVGSVVLFLMLVLGSSRRCTSSIFVKFPIWAAYTLSYSLVSYTIGLMQSSSSGNDLFVVWAICLVMVLGTADCISAFSLQDNSDWKRYYTQLILQLAFLGRFFCGLRTAQCSNFH
ncbi:hypothetical protein Cni_G22103 [Canna indica]|uniref:DUF4220 domain-containing protein n=1 Tax=Canna indica TaxID=4628 RepID=A0AAQ3QKW9_9LILI|nr:hypothetical protein Cni_G22103 [Canna indica]